MISLVESISPHDKYCDGYGNPGASGVGYFMGLMLGVGKAPSKLGHKGSEVLDGINAFDRAEVDDVYLGQVNMITVSSFCGPMGSVWGYDVVRDKNLVSEKMIEVSGVPVYSAEKLIKATRMLYGTVDGKRFPFMPGAHVPCAEKCITRKGPVNVYAAVGMGVPAKRDQAACLMMEDVGEFDSAIGSSKYESDKNGVIDSLAKSILEVGKNQDIEYQEIFTSVKSIEVGKDEVGSALVAAPYFTLARDAIPQGGIETLRQLTLEQWLGSVRWYTS